MWYDADMSASYHMFKAPEAPAPTAMARIAISAMTGSIAPGAVARPTKAVKTTSDMTRGFNSARKSPGMASDTRNSGASVRLCFSTRAICCSSLSYREKPPDGRRFRCSVPQSEVT
jgi:hypothetical protein